MYWSTGSQLLTFLGSKGNSSLLESTNLKKYHDESTKVSIVSVSLFASVPHLGHFVFMNSSLLARGDSFVFL